MLLFYFILAYYPFRLGINYAVGNDQTGLDEISEYLESHRAHCQATRWAEDRR